MNSHPWDRVLFHLKSSAVFVWGLLRRKVEVGLSLGLVTAGVSGLSSNWITLLLEYGLRQLLGGDKPTSASWLAVPVSSVLIVAGLVWMILIVIRENKKTQDELRRNKESIPPNLEPVQGNNWAFFGEGKHTENCEFTVGSELRLIVGSKDTTLLGIEINYYANSWQCLKGGDKLSIVRENEKYEEPTGTFEKAIPLIAKDVLSISYSGGFRPPSMSQTPAECDFGEFSAKVFYKISDSSKTDELTFYFAFMPGGRLEKAQQISAPSRMSDFHVNLAHKNGVINKDQLDSLMELSEAVRSKDLRFGSEEAYNGPEIVLIKRTNEKMIKAGIYDIELPTELKHPKKR